MAELAHAAFARLMTIIKSAEAVIVPVGGGRVALIDEDDAPLVLSHRWTSTDRYALTTIDGKAVPMHRMIMAPADGVIIDHEDGDGFNNQRHNLRCCSHTENMRNRCRSSGKSRFKGVWLSRGVWRAQIGINGQVIKLGSFTTERSAAKAYDKAALLHFGEFAKTNKQLGLY